MDGIHANKSNGVGFNFLPATEEFGALAKYEIGEVVHKTVRAMVCIYKSDQGFHVYEVDDDGRRFIIAGTFAYPLALNAFYHVTGEVAIDKKGVRQLKVQECESTLPTDEEGILTVLRTLHGLDIQAYKLYSVIGPKILEVLRDDPAKVAMSVKGVGLKRAKGWQAELLSRGDNDREVKKLYALGLSPKQATRLIADFGIHVCSDVARNPYFLVGKVHGYNFKKCDKIALDGGWSINDHERIKEGILYMLSQVEERGHCAYPFDVFLKSLHELLEVSFSESVAKEILRSSKSGRLIDGKWGSKEFPVVFEDVRNELEVWRSSPHPPGEKFRYVVGYIEKSLIDAAIQDLKTGERLVVETVKEVAYIVPGIFHRAEGEIAANVRDLVANERLPFKSVEKVLAEVLAELGVQLEIRQMEAVLRICAAEGGLFILNGSAGCGKTFTLNIIMRVLKKLYAQERAYTLNPCILAPTGKASKVAASSTKLLAKTIHKALGLVSDIAGSMTSGSVLSNNCIVVDEVSMVDELLCSKLLQGVHKTSKVILLGDTEQLPSIRAGRVLKDLIASGVVPVITLDVVKRQGATSGILINANKIIKGEHIDSVVTNENGLNGNAYVRSCNDQFKAQAQIMKLAKNCGLKAFQLGRVQVLCPLKSGATGVSELNYILQQVLNPHGDEEDEVVVGSRMSQRPDGSEESVKEVLRVGDCVIHIKNNYEQPWYEKHPINGFIETAKSGVVNGDTGVIDTIATYKDSNKQTHRVIYVRYDKHFIAYDNDYDELMLAYALTVHKSQGSQWPMVICPIVQPTRLLNRKLLYTMYTRAQETSIVIGEPWLIKRAIANNQEDLRITLLKERLLRQV